MDLTATQLSALRLDLQGLAHIEHDEVLDELLDHYAMLTKQKMSDGHPFDEASKWAWAELGSGVGLQAVQDDYVLNIQRQVRNRHFEIIKSYLRWPAFVTTALIGALVYLTVPLLPTDVVKVSFWLLALLPIAITMWGYRKSLDHSSSGRITFQYMGRRMSGLPLNIGTLFFIFDNPKNYLQTHTTVLVLVCLLSLLYTVSFMQLFREKFTLKIA